MKKFLVGLFCKKSALVITTICASATIATTAVVLPNLSSKDDEKLNEVVVGESTKKLQDKMDAKDEIPEVTTNNDDENAYTEAEVTNSLETSSKVDESFSVTLNSQKSSTSQKESKVTEPEEKAPVASTTTSKVEKEKEQETAKPEEKAPVTSTATYKVEKEKAPEVTEPEEKTPVASETTSKVEEKEPEVVEPEKQTPVASAKSEVEEEKTPTTGAKPTVEEESKTTETKKEGPKASEEPEVKEEQEVVEPKKEVTPETSSTPKVEQQKPEVDEQEEQAPEVSTKPETEEPKQQEETEQKEQAPVVPSTPKVEEEEQEPNATEPKKEETPAVSTTPEVEEEQEQEPKEEVVEPKEEPKNQAEPEEKVQQNEELIKIIQEAVEKTKNADSAYLTKYRTSIYPENSKIKYNKSQNRRLYIDGDVEEYLEGFPGRYTTEFNASRYYYQTWWRKNQETNQWEKQGTIHSSFGISELGYLREIKLVEKLNIRGCPFDVYDITLDKSFANIAGANLLNTPNLFKTDVKLTIMIDHAGYIISIECDWTKDVLNNPSLGPITMKIHMGDFNATKVDKPKDLKEEPVNNSKVTTDELTPNKKEIIKSSIYDAYKKTYNANSATYNLNGKEVKYDIKSNSALVENTDGTTTYYKGAENKYVDHNYVTPEFHQDSWTKAKDSEVWKENVKKHTCFIPKELSFLRIIFDVKKVEASENMTTYTIEVLKQYANNAYSYANDTSDNKFNSNITFTVSIDKEGYIREIHINSEGYKVDLVISNINNTNVEKPQGIK